MKPYYQDDLVTLYHGDCREILPTLACDMTLTDPPYNVGLNYCDGDSRPDYQPWCIEWFSMCPEPVVMTPGIVNLPMWLRIREPRWICAWMKPNQCSSSALNGFNAWEPVLVYGRHVKPVGQDVWIVPVASQREASGHPCPKSESFWLRLVEQFTEPATTIVDPFVGSGTTLVAAKRLGRKAVGIEKNQAYCEMTVERLRQGSLSAMFQP